MRERRNDFQQSIPYYVQSPGLTRTRAKDRNKKSLISSSISLPRPHPSLPPSLLPSLPPPSLPAPSPPFWTGYRNYVCMCKSKVEPCSLFVLPLFPSLPPSRPPLPPTHITLKITHTLNGRQDERRTCYKREDAKGRGYVRLAEATKGAQLE